MSEPSILRAMGVPVPGELDLAAGIHLAMTVRPPQSLPITVWAIAGTGRADEIGVATLSSADVLHAMTGSGEFRAPSARVEKRTLSNRAGYLLADDLRAARLLALADKPQTGTDGLSMDILAFEVGCGPRVKLSAWQPSGGHREVLIRLSELAWARFANVAWAAPLLDRARRPDL